jgi:selenocysteine lyase/cysteine desulfurase
MLTRRSFVKSMPAALVSTHSGISQPLAIGVPSETRLPVRDAFIAPQFEVCLNNARWHPLSIAARKATEAYLEYKSRGIWNQNGLVSPAAILVRESFAKLIHATPDEVAFVQSTTAGENLAVSALGLTQPGLTHEGRFNIVTDALHFEGSLYLYSELKRRGIDVRIVGPHITDEGWSIEKADIEKVVDRNTRLIAVSWVSMINGFTHDIGWLASLAHAHGARLFVDAVQAAGCLPIDVRATGVDFLATASYKWLMGDFGLGFLYARSDMLPALQRTQWSYRQFSEMEYHAFPGDPDGPFPATFDQLHTAAGYFETGTYANAVLAALSHSLPWIEELGVANIQQHARALNARLRKEMPQLGFACITPAEAQGAIISFAVKDDAGTAAKLKRANVDVSLNPRRMRVSPSIYNNEADVEALLEALR